MVLKEFPILGPESVEAHKVSNAVKLLAPKKYPEFQRTLLGSRGRANEAKAMEVATSLGLKEADLRNPWRTTRMMRRFRKPIRLPAISVSPVTPSYVIGNEAVFGAVGARAIEGKDRQYAQFAARQAAH